MPNALVNPNWVTKETARGLVNKLAFAKRGNISFDYNDEFVHDGAKMGMTIQARLPQRFTVVKGQGLVPQAINDQYVPVTLTDQAQIGIEFSTASLTMEVDMYKSRYIDRAVEALANQIEYDGLSRMYKTVYNTVGTFGTTPTTNLTYLQAGAKLTYSGCPEDNRIAVLDPNSQVTLANANLAVFNPQSTISQIFRDGQFASDALNIDRWYKSANAPMHTVGALGGTPAIDGANQTGSSVLTKNWTSAVANRLLAGDVIQFAGVYSVNPQNRVSTGNLQDFVVLADVASTSGGAATITISPSIVISGQGQTVTGSPADSALISVFGLAAASQSTIASTSAHQCLIYHPEAFTMVTADLEKPPASSVWVSERESSKQLGISIRFIKDYVIGTDQSPARLDVLYGFAAIQPQLACRVLSF